MTRITHSLHMATSGSPSLNNTMFDFLSRIILWDSKPFSLWHFVLARTSALQNVLHDWHLTAHIPHNDFIINSIFQILYDDKVLGRFCGLENSADGNHPGNQPILSPGNRLTLVFQSDNNNPERHQNVGFFAQYQAIGITSSSVTPLHSIIFLLL